jgi:hypothetical protein
VLLLFFTCEDIAWLKHTLVTLEGVLTAQPYSLPTLPTVQKTITQLQKKLSRTREQHTYHCEVPMTNNEVVTQHTAVRVFLLAVEQLADCPEKQKALSHCLALRSQLISNPFR